MVLQGLKPRIFDQLNNFAGHWVPELPAVLLNLWGGSCATLRLGPWRPKGQGL
jgi:hypothetical protein